MKKIEALATVQPTTEPSIVCNLVIFKLITFASDVLI